MLNELKREAYEVNLLLPKHRLINLTFQQRQRVRPIKGHIRHTLKSVTGSEASNIKYSGIIISLEVRKCNGKSLDLHSATNDRMAYL